VAAAGISGGSFRGPLSQDGVPPAPPGQALMSVFHSVSAGYLHAIGMRLESGRWMTDDEPADAVMVNESLARREFGAENPVGKRLRVSGDIPTKSSPATIVGVLADLKYAKLDADPEPEVYIPYRQLPLLQASRVVIRTVGDPRAVGPDLRKRISDIDRTQPVVEVTTLDQELADSIAPRRFNMMLLAIFAGIAVLLAAVGIYGVMSYAVTQRTQEIGVRIALGARQEEVVRMVVRQGMAVVVAGVGVGLIAAFALTRLMGSLLYEVKPSDPQTFGVVCLVLASAAWLACWLPARRAAGVDPVVALRYE